MPEILRICESIGISHNGSVAFSYLWKSDEKINEGYLKIVDSGIFNLLEEHILSDDEKLSVLNDIDFINGYKAFQVLFYFCNVGIVREIDDGQLAKASRQIEILMYVRSEYPTLHSIADNKESHMIICRNLIKKKLQVQSRSL